MYEINAIDRKYNFWQRDSLNIELFTPAVFHQKLNSIHYNPVRANLCNLPEDYYYSSAMFLWKRNRPFWVIRTLFGITQVFTSWVRLVKDQASAAHWFRQVPLSAFVDAHTSNYQKPRLGLRAAELFIRLFQWYPPPWFTSAFPFENLPHFY